MPTPQQPDLHRSGLSAADAGSAKVHEEAGPHVRPGPGEGTAPVPEDNRPGHHPPVEQDKPVERFAARARELAEEAHEHDQPGSGPPPAPEDAALDVPVAPELPAEARGTAEADLAGPASAEPGEPAGEPAEPAGEPAEPAGGGHNALLAPALAVWGAVRDQPAALVVVPPLAAWDALRQPGEAWAEIDESRTGWLARIVLVPFVGGWRYATGVRPRLDGARVALRLRGG